MKKINPWLFSLLLVPYIIIFRAFFLKSVLAFGDAPYFFPQFLSQLLNIPFAWDARSTNLGGSSIQTLWLFMPTFLMGLFYNLSHFDSETLSKIIFYFPATILSIVGSYLLLGLFTKDKLARILGCFFYSFNSYFLILVDGGQVGVSLSYGIFPLAIYLYMRLTRDYKISSFVFCLISFFALSNIDLRVFIIFLATIFGVILSKRILNKTYTNFFKDAKLLALLTFCTLLLDGFWLLPLFFGLFNNQTSLSFESSNLVSIKLIDSLFFYQPHFPLNEFGNYANVPFYYVFLPVLILLGGFLSKGVKKISIFLSLIALILIFLTKGSGDPLGFIYQFLVDKVPFGVAFRDSSKLFIPLLLIGSILISINFNSLKASLKKTHYLVLGLIIYFYLLFLIYPAFLGGLRGTLNNPVSKADFDQVNQKIIDSSDFSRSVWFPEKPPLGYFDLNHPALSANTLYKLRPFASMIDGDYDFFYFLHSNQLVQWFNLLGIKYAAFPENERQKIYSSKQLAERRQFLDFVNLTPNFKKEKSNLPLYRIDGNKPHIFGQKKIYFVVGGEEIYQRLISLPNFNLAAQSFVFIEQGLLNRKDLENYLKMGNSALVYVNRSKIELALGLLSEKMISTVGVSGNSWSQKKPSEYLQSKAFLKQRGIDTFDFDFNKGVSISTVKGEKLKINLPVPKNRDNLYLLVRYTNASDSAGIKINFANQEKQLYNSDFNHFHWSYSDSFTTKNNYQAVEITNLGGTVAVNTLMILDYPLSASPLTSEFNSADYTDHEYSLSNPLSAKSFFDDLGQNIVNVKSNQINPTKYEVDLSNKPNWLVFSDSYDPNWQLEGQVSRNKAIPFYAMINGFSTKGINDKKAIINLVNQQDVINGIYLSLVSFVVIVGGILFIKFKAK